MLRLLQSQGDLAARNRNNPNNRINNNNGFRVVVVHTSQSSPPEMGSAVYAPLLRGPCERWRALVLANDALPSLGE